MLQIVDQNFVPTAPETDLLALAATPEPGAENPPHAVVESPSAFSIVMNLLGVSREDVALEVNGDKREIAVVARKGSRTRLNAFYWVFGVPAGAAIEAITTRFRGGVLEIRVPKGRVSAIRQLAAVA